MRRAFTMVELIMTIVIMGILAAGAYVSLAKLFAKSARTKAITELSLESTLITNQIAGLLRDRIPSTVIGYDPAGGFESIYTISKTYPIMEWISADSDALLAGMYSGFVDLDRCDRDTDMLYSPATDINATDRALIFAGAYDEGDVAYDAAEFNASFGWHGNTHTKIYELNATSSGNDIYLRTRPAVVYEKYSLVRSAYAIARYPDIKQDAACIQSLGLDSVISDKTLFLFYGYRPWKGETFCADPNGTQREGNVTILSDEASGFEADYIDGNLQFSLTLERTIRRPGKDLNITISKQQVVY